MTHLEAFGSIAVFLTAAVFGLCCVVWHAGKRYGVEEYLCERQALRSARRREARHAAGAQVRRRLEPFPADVPADDDDEWLEKLATTGELRMYAETGQVDRLRGEVAQFFRTWSLREWARKREDAA